MKCPKCGQRCNQDEVDNGVGVQYGWAWCDCGYDEQEEQMGDESYAALVCFNG